MSKKQNDIFNEDLLEIELTRAYTQGMEIGKKIGYIDAKMDAEELLNEYSEWLEKHSYIDTDYYTEEPKAVEAFLQYKEQKNEKNNN